MKLLLASLCASVAGAGWWTWPCSPCEDIEGPCTPRVECTPSEDVCVIECEGPDGVVCSYEISCSELESPDTESAAIDTEDCGQLVVIDSEDCELLETSCAATCR